MRIELARGPLDGERFTIDRHGPLFYEDPREAGHYCLYARSAEAKLRGRGQEPTPVYEFVVRLTREEMLEAMRRAGVDEPRILRGD